tara:strand:- start:38 stop:409 length:372 start_codon:yes stop_codon:yes gene_type:complete
MEIQITQRQLRVSELLRQKIADILLRGNIHDKNLSRYSITVSQVIVSPDLKSGKVFVSFLGEKNSDQILKDLNNYAFKIQKQVGKNLRLKRTPKLKFFIDDSFDNAAKINKSINSISDIDSLR